MDLRASLVPYAAVAPLQECIVGAGVQTPAVSRRSTRDGAANRRVGCAPCLRASPSFGQLRHRRILSGVAVGAMFARRGNAAGVGVSHVLCGCFGFLVLGFEL